MENTSSIYSSSTAFQSYMADRCCWKIAFVYFCLFSSFLYCQRDPIAVLRWKSSNNNLVNSSFVFCCRLNILIYLLSFFCRLKIYLNIATEIDRARKMTHTHDLFTYTIYSSSSTAFYFIFLFWTITATVWNQYFISRYLYASDAEWRCPCWTPSLFRFLFYFSFAFSSSNSFFLFVSCTNW